MDANNSPSMIEGDEWGSCDEEVIHQGKYSSLAAGAWGSGIHAHPSLSEGGGGNNQAYPSVNAWGPGPGEVGSISQTYGGRGNINQSYPSVNAYGSVVGGIPIATHCHLKNHTDDYLTLDSQNFWHGYGHTPKSIESEENGCIKHRADDGGSIGGVAYLLEDKNIKWVVAWSNAEDRHNKVYTKILKANEAIDWADIKRRLRKSGNQCSVSNVHGYTSKLEIHSTSARPRMIAKLRPVS